MPFLSWQQKLEQCPGNLHQATLEEDSSHSARSLVRGPLEMYGKSKGRLLGGSGESVDGVGVSCLSPGQLEPLCGEKGELKRCKQFLIRGNYKRGKRSIKRAQRRADVQGMVNYKGRVLYGVCIKK